MLQKLSQKSQKLRQRLSSWPVIAATVASLFVLSFVALVPQGTVHAQAVQDTNSPTLDCEILDSNPLNWFGCPIVTGLQTTVNGLNAAIDAMLTVKTTGPGSIFSPEYKTAWSSFRALAIGIIIIGGLIMLASQAMGLEILDAYTFRKVVPRLIIAVILTAISWELLRFLVTLSNDAGNSVRAIIYQPFQGLGGPLGEALRIGNSAKIVSTLVSLAGLFVLGLPAILSFVATAALAVGIAFIILLTRQMIIIFLVIVSPFALACYVLPNTQKVFDFWKGTLLSMLVVFPIISAMIAIGRVFSVVAYGTTAAGGIPLIQQVTAFIAFFLPYLLLPFAFRLAGGAIATIAGIANDRGKGAFDRLSNYRGTKATENIAAMKAGERYKGNNAVSRRFNNATFRAGLGAKNGFGFGERGKSAAEQRQTLLGMQHAKTDEAQAGQYNDSMLQAQTYANENEARTRLMQDFGMNVNEREQAIAAAKANGGFSRARQSYATNQLAATGTGYKDQEQMLQTIARVSNGNENTMQALVGSARGLGEKAGRYDLKSGYGTQTALAKYMMENKGAVVREDMLAADVEAAQGASAAQRAQSKPTATKNAVVSLQAAMDSANAIARDGSRKEPERRAAAEYSASISATLKNMEGAKMYGPEAYSQALYKGTSGANGLNASNSNKSNILEIDNRIDRASERTTYRTEERLNPSTGKKEKVKVEVIGGYAADHIDVAAKEKFEQEHSARGNYDPNDPRFGGKE